MPLRCNPPNPDLGQAPNMLAAHPVAWLPHKYNNLTKNGHAIPRILTSKSWYKGSNTSAFRNLVVNEERMRPMGDFL